MRFVSTTVQLFDSPVNGKPLRMSRCDDPVRVLDCVPDFSDIPGGVTDNAGAIYYLAEERADYLRKNTMDVCQVGHPPDVGFALVPRKLLIDTPF